MAQLPLSLRRHQAATTSIHDKPPSLGEKLLSWGSWLLLIFAILVFVFGGYALYQRFMHAEIDHVDVVGVSAPAQQALIQHIKADTASGYFTTDLEQIRDHALGLSWVDRVVVSRAWPNAIVLRVTPRHAVARWGTGRYLSDDGVVFKPVQGFDHRNLPLLHGPNSQSRMMMTKYRDINQMFSPMNMRLKELYLTERMTWFMQFDNGMRLIVDQDQTMGKLQRLSEIAKTDLGLVWDNIAGIDLRYRNGLAVQWKNAQPVNIHNGQFVIPTPSVAVAEQTQSSP
ncbi:cell division protein FtsQ/DivIB [Acinetobacter sp. A3.8]|uniref:Cell division protein FtsQ n=1 Tax=Acinetobacter sedimenti TaxID=2919922 RepID=A0A9X2B6L3_9GAMM|nr:cell division protein FtsQ/DivIB [Acinetobacter sedimenti]MCJ8146843.1 cell division protein FtsQ/DivIB [Acinetobacter sedimenti]